MTVALDPVLELTDPYVRSTFWEFVWYLAHEVEIPYHEGYARDRSCDDEEYPDISHNEPLCRDIPITGSDGEKVCTEEALYKSARLANQTFRAATYRNE